MITYCEHAKYGLVWGGLLRCQKWEIGMVLGERLRLKVAAEGFPSKFWGIEHGEGLKVDGYAGGDNYLWRIGACVKDEKIAG